MLSVNLLPNAGKRRSRGGGAGGRALRVPQLSGLPFDPWMAGMGTVGTLLLLGIGFSFWSTGTQKAELEAKTTEAVADSTRLSRTIELVDQLKARQDTIQLKIGVIQEVDGRRFVYPHLLDEVSRAVPPYTWLTKLNSMEEAPAAPADSGSVAVESVGPGFTVEGNTANTQALTRFMKNLEASPFVRDVTLVTSEQASEQGRTFQKFTLEARYEQPDSTALRTVPAIVVN